MDIYCHFGGKCCHHLQDGKVIVMCGARKTIWLWVEQEGAITQRNGHYGLVNGGGGGVERVV